MPKSRSKKVALPEFEYTKCPEYRYVYATGVFGGLDPVGGRIIFYLDRPEPEMTKEGTQRTKKIIRELQVEVHVSPGEFKAIWEWMGKHIKQLEDLFGEIPLGPKKGRPPPEGIVS